MKDDYKRLREIAGGSGLHFFVARADRRNPPPPVEDGAGRSLNVVAGLEHLASALNAPATINLQGSDGSPLLRVVQRTSGYYRLGIEPTRRIEPASSVRSKCGRRAAGCRSPPR
jgi:hypothetical protein